MARLDGTAPRVRKGWPKPASHALAAGILVSAAAGGLTLWRQELRIEREFENLTNSVRATLEQQREQEMAALRALRALWHSSRTVEAGEFRDFARALFDERASLRELRWVERVPALERDRFERELKNELGPDARITTPDRRTAPRTSVHFVTRYVTAQEAPLVPVGVDIGLDPSMLSLLQRAIARDGVEIMAESGGSSAAFYAALPIRTDARASDPARIPGELEGLVVGAFDLQCLLDHATARYLDVEVELAAFAMDGAPGSAAIAAVGPTLAGASRLAQAHPHGEFTFQDHGWRIVCAPTALWLANRRTPIPWMLFGSGLLLTATIAWWIRSIAARNISLSKANADLYTEIAERHTIERELRETQRALATLVANLPGVAYRCKNDPDWPMEFISDGCIPLTGYTPSDYLTGRISFGHQLIHEDDRQYVWNAVQQALDRQRPFQIVYRMRTASGGEKWCWEQGRGVYSRAGELLALEGFIADITERKQAEEALQREKSFIDATIESLPGNFYVFDDKGNFLRWNRNVERVTGWSPAELAQMSPIEFFHGEDRERVARAVAQVFETGQTRIEAALARKDGSTVLFDFTGVRFTNEGRHFLVGVGIDLSARESARAEAEQLRSEVLRTQKLEALSVMAGSIAHDFNNLLTVVLGSTGLAQQAVQAGSPAHDFLEQAIGASRSAAHLTQQLLSFVDSRASDLKPLDLSQSVRDQAELLRTSIPKRVALEFELSESTPAIRAAPAQIQQLLLNLVLNAAEACAARRGRVRVSTGCTDVDATHPCSNEIRGTRRSGSHVFLSVQDDGSGMTPEVLASLGTPFFTTKRLGRGLGLAAVQGIVTELSGWMEFDSAPGTGTTASVFFASAVPPPDPNAP